ncbi:metal-dependent hydrolase [Luteimonas fraxinea]|uniref:Metal-dependent hydrolase n=1 Tax=Luteimonas fraxinea TaxID=2901869 RepID=A0ABS8UGH6_9GAMM|nr:metal-dependent hydrolase [Luteimonas fraxinea]MCD9098000.1 metal-dependent hydrolase [Luteimonas fraxinea]UHH09271.1 metal-dependent hydrolase [Luteimonas fraxinea]
MDSLTQIVLGASVAAAIVPAAHRRAALAAGAVLGTLPDLDGFPIALMTDDPVLRMTLHRGLTHSLLVLPLIAAAIWWLFKRFGKGRVAASPVRWFWAIALALITHPLLDAFTVYGTQLWWPLTPPPAMWSSVFIIDPLYTVWLLIGVLVAAFAGPRLIAGRLITVGLVLSTAYLGWSLVAKTLVDREADRALVAMGLGDAPRFSVPMPANTVLWRVVAMTDDGYVEGFRSLVADRGPMQFTAYPSDVAALRENAGLPAVQRLAWFNHGFMGATVVDGTLQLSDLRMGNEPDYFFRFDVAQRTGDGWTSIPPTQAPMARDIASTWNATWARIWREPASPGLDIGEAVGTH